jgi:hypothetical protein
MLFRWVGGWVGGLLAAGYWLLLAAGCVEAFGWRVTSSSPHTLRSHCMTNTLTSSFVRLVTPLLPPSPSLLPPLHHNTPSSCPLTVWRQGLVSVEITTQFGQRAGRLSLGFGKYLNGTLRNGVQSRNQTQGTTVVRSFRVLPYPEATVEVETISG